MARVSIAIGGDDIYMRLTDSKMDIVLEELVSRWRGRHAVLDITLARPDAADPQESFHYEGILDGPYGDNGSGVGFMLGSRLISGDIAVGGPFESFDPERPGSSAKPILSDGYVELRATELPLIAHVDGDGAAWEVSLGDGRVARCRICTSRLEEGGSAKGAGEAL